MNQDSSTMPSLASALIIRPTDHDKRLALRSQTTSIVGPGRILNKILLAGGQTLGNRVNRIAHGLGKGPVAVTQRIEDVLDGQSSSRVAVLDMLYQYLHGESGAHSRKFLAVEKDCKQLMKHTLPSESLGAQLHALKNIIMLTTRYPGLRRLFPPYNSRGSILALWRKTGEPWDSDPDLVFYRDLAALCLVDNDITRKVENIPPRQLGSVEENDSVITTLLAEIATRERAQLSAAVRYLGGILELPTYWHGTPLDDSLLSRVASKSIFERARDILLDIGLDDSDKDSSTTFKVQDTDGVDILAHAILVGLEFWIKPSLDRKYLKGASWFPACETFIKLLRMPKAQDLVPISCLRVETDEFRSVFPVTPNITETLVVSANVDVNLMSRAAGWADFDIHTPAIMKVHSDWGEAKTTSINTMFRKDPNVEEDVYQDVTFTDTSIRWGGHWSYDFLESPISIPFMIVHSGSPSIDIETSHGDDRSEGGDGAGWVEVYFESNWYTNHLVDGQVWNLQTFENCPVLPLPIKL